MNGREFCRGVNQKASKKDLDKDVMNENFSSVSVPSGLQVTAYTDEFDGESITYTSDVSDLGDMNDKISSVHCINVSVINIIWIS